MSEREAMVERATKWPASDAYDGMGGAVANLADFALSVLDAERGKRPDSVVESVIARHRERAARGLSKYGVTMDRTDLSELDWLNHAQEEAMDLAVYLERLKAATAAREGR